ncbi:MAG: site-specific integrase [Actinobacteria bacterium]|nr:site-specific integrase [Actinomycetota bacterium]
MLEDWLEVHRTQVQHSTWRSYEQAVRCYLVPGLHGVYVRELAPAMLTRLYAQLLERGGLRGKPLSIATVQRIHHILRRALDQLVDDEVIDRNPAAKATVPRRDPRTGADPTVRELRTWTAAQVRVFLASTVGHEYADVWRLAIGTGMRRGELLGLRWDDVDSDGRRLVVRKSLTVIDGRPELKTIKSSRPRIVTLDAATWQAIEHRAADRPPRNPLDVVFTDASGDPILPDRVTRAWRKLMTELPLPRLRLHDLRHTHASLLLAQGVPVKVVSERLGHASVQITLDVYAHVLPSMDADAAATFGALLDRGS